MTRRRERMMRAGVFASAALMGPVLALTLASCEESSSDDHGDGSGGSSSGGASGGAGGSNAGGSPGTGSKPGTGGKSGTGGEATGGEGGAGGEGGLGGAGGEPPLECTHVLSESEWTVLGTLSPLGAVPADATNAYADNPGAAALGQKFFFDPDFSGALVVASDLGEVGETGKVACASCHLSPMMSDHRSHEPYLGLEYLDPNVSLGANFHTRNAPGMVNSSFYAWTNWGGRFSRQWELPMPVTESPVIMNSSRLQVAHVIFDKYQEDYEAVFGAEFGPLEEAIGTDLGRFPASGKPKPAAANPDGPWEAMTAEDRAIVTRIFVNYAKSLAAYTRLLVSRNAPVDRFVAGDCDALSESEQRGFQVFLGQGDCARCHNGPHFSDDAFHNIGVAQVYPGIGAHVPASDDGRFKDIPQLLASGLSSAVSPWSDDPGWGQALLATLDPTAEANRAGFRTPTLRGVAHTAPYMHAGQLATLEDVIEFYDRGGDTPAAGTKTILPLGLDNQQKEDLLAFLLALTGEPVPEALLVDTSVK